MTATGDTVNVASRLLEVAKQQGSGVVVSENLYRAAELLGSADDTLMTRLAIEVNIRGRTEPLRVRVASSRQQPGRNRDGDSGCTAGSR
jgi:adenylate cyclase